MKQINLFDNIFVDNFAGGGGASTGIELATGQPVSIAINHDESAILMHKRNHPYTEHYQEDVWSIDPKEVVRGRHVRLAWFSPDCKHFSRAKGAAEKITAADPEKGAKLKKVACDFLNKFVEKLI